MALNNDAVVKVSTAHFFTAPVGTPLPTGGVVNTPWEEMGHTPVSDILSITFEGGEATTLGSLQNSELRTARSPRTATMNMSLLQWDTPGKKLFLGANAMVDSEGRVGPAANPTPTETAVYILVEDGDNYMDLVLPKAEIIGSGDLSLADTESLAALPLAITPLRKDESTAPFYVGDMKPKAEPEEG
ncbi:hypothetical protein [Brevibacterium sp. CFH 10365]|uniref:phage tail tube protein n=1 Tax=Brevibacterium sp. CFH 10365 TaxID=2585207 RepID=UPI0012665068|nr:hypothetical protein [Brevibacterium sp. CFH 10365]